MAETTILTGADERFARALYQMLRSAERHRLHEDNSWTAWDLGMMPPTRSKLQRRFAWCRFETFDFSAYPPHVALEAGSYAWKPIIIWKAAESSDKAVLWFDSATVFKGPLTPMLDTIRRTGVYSLAGQAPMLERCDPQVLKRLGFPRRLYGTRERFAGLFGFDAGHAAMRTLVQRWRDLSLDAETIRPAERSIARHMNDQAVLSCLLLQAAYHGTITFGGEDVDISSANPIRFLSTRNKIWPWLPEWADPLARAWYAAWKWGDRLALRLDRRRSWRLVWSKWRRERFAIHFRGPDGIERAVENPAGHYYADPFVWEHDGRTWLFCEDYSYRRLKAKIVAIPLGADLTPGEAVPALDPGVHASFPHLIAHEGKTYMVPETADSGGIDLYECASFPGTWLKVRRLLDGVNAVDTVIFLRGGTWWLISSLLSPDSGGSNRYLAVYSTDDLVAGAWKPHPINEEALYIEARQGTGRNAGAVVMQEGRIFRPMQQSSDFYGQGMAIMEIGALGPTRFDENPALQPYPFEGIAGRDAVHHATEHGGIVCWDVRVR